MASTLITICARGGSKGIPGKNIKPVAGRPLIDYTIDAALAYAAESGSPVVLSTDSDEIRAVAARRPGVDCSYRRPDDLANDICGKPDAIRHVLMWAEETYGTHFDRVLDLDVTSPIRTLDDIRACIRIADENPQALTVFSVSPCARNPYFTQVQQRPDGFYSEVMAGGNFTSRQSAPKVYDMNGSIYVYTRQALLSSPHPRAVSPRALIYCMDHLCFDLDEPMDYDYLSFLLETGRVDIRFREATAD